MFEYDQNKSDKNQIKHGIDFDAAQALWNDSSALEFSVETSEEPRFFVIGMIDEKHWTAVITYRGENIRIISVRRSRINEVKAYES